MDEEKTEKLGVKTQSIKMKIKEDFVHTWSIKKFVLNILYIFFFSFIGGLLVIVYIAFQFNINMFTFFLHATPYLIPGIFLLIMLARKMFIYRYIKWVENNDRYRQLYNTSKTATSIQLFLSACTIIIIYLDKIDSTLITNTAFFLMLSIIFMYLPIFFAFQTILNEKGLAYIEFNELNKNIDHFLERQYWIRKIANRISDTFKKGNLRVNKDELRSKFNLEMRNNVDMIPKINEMKNWFLCEDKKDDLFSIFEKIWPNVKIEPYVGLTWHDRIELLPYQYVKLILGLIITLIVIIQNPSLINDILKQFMDKLL